MKVEKKLNIDEIQNRALEKGLNQAEISRKLDVTREAVSKWFNSENLPTPNKLLKLSKLLDLPFEDILIVTYLNEPVVSFRKNRKSPVTDRDNEKANKLAMHIEKLLPYISPEYLMEPPKFIKPTNEYEYIQKVVEIIRNKMKLKDDVINYDDLIKIYSSCQAILIPVLWGKRDDHINALRIFLPETLTNWIYFSLDLNELDLKFWMAHELAHLFAPNIKEEIADDFADHFAGALLFPDKLAQDLYNKLNKLTKKERIETIIDYASKFTISPITIYLRVKEYAENNHKTIIDLDKDIYRATSHFSKNYKLLSESLFTDGSPNAKEYIYFVTKKFKSPIFEFIKKYVKENKKSSSFIHELLDIPIIDAYTIHEEL